MRQRREVVGTSLRYSEDENGGDPLPNEASSKSGHRDGAARTRLQSHPRHEHHGHSAADGRDPSIVKAEKLARIAASPSTDLFRQNVLTRPRPKADIGMIQV